MKNFQFDYNNDIYQIRFSYPDKWEGIFRRLTNASLFKKVINPEDNKDFVWEEIDWAEAKCKVDIKYLESGVLYNFGDKFDKYIGRKVAFTKLINNNFDRDFRKKLWEMFFDLYGLKVNLRGSFYIGALAES